MATCEDPRRDHGEARLQSDPSDEEEMAGLLTSIEKDLRAMAGEPPRETRSQGPDLRVEVPPSRQDAPPRPSGEPLRRGDRGAARGAAAAAGRGGGDGAGLEANSGQLHRSAGAAT